MRSFSSLQPNHTSHLRVPIWNTHVDPVRRSRRRPQHLLSPLCTPPLPFSPVADWNDGEHDAAFATPRLRIDSSLFEEAASPRGRSLSSPDQLTFSSNATSGMTAKGRRRTPGNDTLLRVGLVPPAEQEPIHRIRVMTPDSSTTSHRRPSPPPLAPRRLTDTAPTPPIFSPRKSFVATPQYLIPPPHCDDMDKLVVVLDLDETLIHSRDTTLFTRPGLIELLRLLKGKCELIVWTAGTRDYALDVIKVIDTCYAIQHCIYRHPMWWSGEYGNCKDLRLLGRPMDRVLLVDNTPEVFRANPRNSILVPDFVVPLSQRSTARDRALYILADIFETVFRRFPNPAASVVLTSRHISTQSIELDSGLSIELNVLVTDTKYSKHRRVLSGPPTLTYHRT